MKTTQKVIIAAGAIVAVGVIAIAAPFIYRDFIAAPAAELPALSADSNMLAEGGSLDAERLEGEWTVGEGSVAGYRVDEVLNGTDVTVTGRTDQVTGTIRIAADEDGALTMEEAEFTVDVATIATDSENRDAYFRDNAINASQHPTATFTLLSPFAIDSIPEAGAVEQATVTGELTIAGVTQQVDVDVAVRSDGEITEIAGSIPIVFADFGVEAPSLGFVQVDPEGFVEFQLTATRG